MSSEMLINIAAREHVEKRLTLEAKAGEGYTVSLGRTRVEKYTGLWAELLAMAEGEIGGGGRGTRVVCELERLAAGLAELTVTYEYFGFASGEEEDDSGGDTGGTGGETESETYTMSSTLVQVSILAHPKFAGIGNDELRALKAMIDGHDEKEVFEEGGLALPLKDFIQSEAAQKAMDYIRKGVFYYLEPSVEATARWKGSSNSYTVGEIVEVAPGGFQSGAGRNWICTGAGKERSGGVTYSTASFRLSAQGGWDKYLYA